jgi:hypothetical protein
MRHLPRWKIKSFDKLITCTTIASKRSFYAGMETAFTFEQPLPLSISNTICLTCVSPTGFISYAYSN